MIRPVLAWLIAAGRSILWRINTAADPWTDRTLGEVAIGPVGCEDVLIAMIDAGARRGTSRRAIGKTGVASTRLEDRHG